MSIFSSGVNSCLTINSTHRLVGTPILSDCRNYAGGTTTAGPTKSRRCRSRFSFTRRALRGKKPSPPWFPYSRRRPRTALRLPRSLKSRRRFTSLRLRAPPTKSTNPLTSTTGRPISFRRSRPLHPLRRHPRCRRCRRRRRPTGTLTTTAVRAPRFARRTSSSGRARAQQNCAVRPESKRLANS